MWRALFRRRSRRAFRGDFNMHIREPLVFAHFRTLVVLVLKTKAIGSKKFRMVSIRAPGLGCGWQSPVPKIPANIALNSAYRFAQSAIFFGNHSSKEGTSAAFRHANRWTDIFNDLRGCENPDLYFYIGEAIVHARFPLESRHCVKQLRRQ